MRGPRQRRRGLADRSEGGRRVTYLTALTYAAAAVEIQWGGTPEGEEILATLHALTESSVVLDDYEEEAK